MRTRDVAGAADSRYRLSCADMLSDTHRDRACEAVGISCLDSAAVVYNDAVTIAGIASAHALDRSVEGRDYYRSRRAAAGKSEVDAGVEVAVTAQGSPAVRRADECTCGAGHTKPRPETLTLYPPLTRVDFVPISFFSVTGLFRPDA